MNDSLVIGDLVVAVLVTFVGSSALSALVSGLMMRGKVRAETEAAQVGVQSKILADLQAYVAVLQERHLTMESRVEKLEESEQRKGRLIGLMSEWQRRVWQLLTLEQREAVGDPPADDDEWGG